MLYDLSNKHDRTLAHVYWERLLKNKKKIELRSMITKRTIDQNSYVHVLFNLYGIEYGYTKEEAKTIIKRACPFMRYEKNGNTFLKGTSDLDTKEMKNFINWFRA